MLQLWHRARTSCAAVAATAAATAAATSCVAPAPLACPALLHLGCSVSAYSTVKSRSPFSHPRGASATAAFDVRVAKEKAKQRGRANPSPRLSPQQQEEAAAAQSEKPRTYSRQGERGAPTEERPDPRAEQQRRMRNKPRRQAKEPTLSDTAHASSVFFKPLSQPTARVQPAAAEATDATSDSTADAVAAAAAIYAASRPRVFDPTQFADATTFQELRLASHVHTKLGQFSVIQPTPIQKHAIPFLLHAPFFTERVRGPQRPVANPRNEADRLGLERRRRAAQASTPRDLVLQDMTGSGKTLAYALPMLSLVDNYSRNTQGIILAPTRELAVQIFRVLQRLNTPSRGGKNKKRRRNPVTIELAVGTVTKEYADSVRAHRPHIIVATPSALQSLVLPPAPVVSDADMDPAVPKTKPLSGFAALSLAHVRLMVLDEIDHLLLPFSAPGVERLLQFYTGSRSHGSVRRTGRLVVVSAAISQRVHTIASKWLNRPVTATSDGLLDGWVSEQHRLRDKFYLQHEGQQQTPAKTSQEDTSTNTAVDPEVDNDEAELDEDLDEEQLAVSRMAPSAAVRPLARRKVNLAEVEEEMRESYDEADAVFNEEDDEAAEAMAVRAMMEADGEIDHEPEAEPEAVDESLPESDESEELDAAAKSTVVHAETFRLPGSDANVPIEAVSLSLDTTSFSNEPADLVGAAAASTSDADVDQGISDPDLGLPLASEVPLRFLPATMKHVVVHVPPTAKLSHFDAHVDTLTSTQQRAAVAAKVHLLTQLHAILKPRVALVFFSNSREAVELADALHKQKGLRAALLVSNARLTVKQKINALNAVSLGRTSFLFATDLASRGLDVRGLSHVINFEPPKTALDYVHRAGRVERLGGHVGCTVVTIVKDQRVQEKQRKTGLPKAVLAAEAAEAAAAGVEPTINADSSSTTSSLPTPSFYVGQQVLAMRKQVAQLHLSEARDVVLQSGQFVDFNPPKPVWASKSTKKIPSTSTPVTTTTEASSEATR